MNCNHCQKYFKTERGYTKHVNNKHTDVTSQFHSFTVLPIELQFHIISFLSKSDIYKFYLANIRHIFKPKYNNYWNASPRFERKNRKISVRSIGYTLLKLHNSLCFYCMKHTATMSPFYVLPMCQPCQIKHHPTITMTRAKKEYKLKQSQLETLHHVAFKNPHYLTGPPMKLYLKTDVEYISKSPQITIIAT